MLKFTYPIGLGLTAVVALPAALSKQSLRDGPEAALNNTLSAIDELLLISEALDRREPGSVQRVLDMTQPPLGPPEQQDAFLVQLREEVGDLRLALASRGQETPGTSGASMPAHPGSSSAAIAGTRTALSRGAASPSSGAPAGQSPAPGSEARAPGQVPQSFRDSDKASLEPEGYVADSLSQGRLLFRAQRFAEAIKVLAGVQGQPEADYWTARSYEALGNVREAIDRYRRLADGTGEAEAIARRAQHDLSFLEWKQRFNGTTEK